MVGLINLRYLGLFGTYIVEKTQKTRMNLYMSPSKFTTRELHNSIIEMLIETVITYVKKWGV